MKNKPIETSLPWLSADWPAPANIKAGTTLRGESGMGHSKGCYQYFNLATHVGDNLDDVTRNREMISMPKPGWLEQVHSTKVVELPSTLQVPLADAAFTQQKGVTCVVLTADCLPLLVTDKCGSCVAAIHAGWRGLNDGIIEATISRLPVKVHNLLVWLGPAIGPQAYEVGEDVYRSFLQQDSEFEKAFTPRTEQHWLLNMYQAARIRLQRLGIENVYGGEFCTFSDESRFYSYRRDGDTGRMASMIWIEK